MTTEVAGALITDEIAKVIETLQCDQFTLKHYIETIDDITRTVIEHCDSISESSHAIERLKTLQLIRRDFLTLAVPIEPDDEDVDFAEDPAEGIF